MLTNRLFFAYREYVVDFPCKIPCNFQNFWISKVNFNSRQLKGLSDASMFYWTFQNEKTQKLQGILQEKMPRYLPHADKNTDLFM
jgi:hypothetical protein